MKVKSSDLSIFLGAAVLAVLIFPDCNSSSKTGDTERKKEISQHNLYLPSSEGNSWEYVNSAPGNETDIFTVKVAEVSNEGTNRIVKLRAFPYFNKEEKEGVLVFKNDGSVSYETLDPASSEPVRANFLPAGSEFTPGYSWNFNSVLKGNISESGQSIVTESGTFDSCVSIIYTDGFTFSYELWFAKNKGIVKWGANRTNPPVMTPVYYVLRKINLN